MQDTMQNDHDGHDDDQDANQEGQQHGGRVIHGLEEMQVDMEQVEPDS